MEGTSSGATIATLITSLALNLPVPTDLIMTGEISLEGSVIAVGSVEEKVEAAKAGGYRHILLPLDNKAQWENIKEDVKADLIIDFVKTFEDIYSIVFVPPQWGLHRGSAVNILYLS